MLCILRASSFIDFSRIVKIIWERMLEHLTLGCISFCHRRSQYLNGVHILLFNVVSHNFRMAITVLIFGILMQGMKWAQTASKRLWNTSRILQGRDLEFFSNLIQRIRLICLTLAHKLAHFF